MAVRSSLGPPVRKALRGVDGSPSVGEIPDIVLVHGTTQSAAGFAWLVTALERAGHRSVCLDVPSAAATTAARYADLLASQVPADLDRPIVVAHSAAGLILPALARRLNARHQVWLAATVADYRGQRSLLEELRHDPSAVFRAEWLGIDPTTDPVLATYFLFHDADLAALRAALPTVASCDLTALYGETPTQDPARLPSTYLLPADDRALTRAAMGHMARERPGVEPVVVPGGHNCYVAHPGEIAQVIDKAARRS